MAFDFSGNAAAKVDHGSDASLDNLTVGTIMFWAYFTDAAQGDVDLVYYDKGDTCEFHGNPDFDIMSLYAEYDGGTSSLVRATAANLAHFGFNKWVFCAGTFGNVDAPILAVGDLDSVAAVPAAYSVQATGVGARVSDAADIAYVGNHAADNRNMLSYIANIHVVETALTLNQIIAQQYRFSPLPNTRLISHYGFHGTGSAPDLATGVNNGTPANIALADHVPLAPPFGFDSSISYAIAAGGVAPTGSLYGPLWGPLAGVA